MVVAERKYNYMEEEVKQQGPKRNNEKKPKQKVKIKASHKVQMIFSIVMIGSLCITILLGYAKLSELKYEIYGLNKEIHQLEGHIQNLKVQVDGVKRSDLIEKKAREELGMQYPDKSQMAFIKLESNNMVANSKMEENGETQEETNKEGLIGGIKSVFYKVISILD
ncbi:septum formation initiator family protein [Crassaminicella profunda]|uniref:septum formation initiator family protein n=1 Tax=Crassaminicella profunda TaxID=1286698 RepID=UPI001CA68D98|nr:septum formation initiator family protein [Crassaminicella profunda]QZY57189.1 septum formation initiator family protein [Crassaminicella profunda]